MLILYVTDPWPLFYKKGMKTWEIRSYKTDYRGEIIIVNSKTNMAICKMTLHDCIPLTRALWEMNYEKHRTSCSFDSLPYRNNKENTAYAWVLSNPVIYKSAFKIIRPDRKPYHIFDTFDDSAQETHIPSFKSERIACKFLNQYMFLYWIKKDYFALIAISDLSTGHTELIQDEIGAKEYEYIANQINANS